MPKRVAPTLSQAHTFRSAACVRLRRGASAAHPRDSDGHPMATRRVTNRQSDDPGLCRRCAAALSSAADAPTYITLGSHAKSGLRMRHSPGRAVTCGHRNGASLSATDATNPAAWRRGSTHPDHRMRGLNRVLLRARTESRTDVATPTRIGASGQTGLGSCKRYLRLSAPSSQDRHSCRACSDRTPNLGCASVAHRDAGSPSNNLERYAVRPS